MTIRPTRSALPLWMAAAVSVFSLFMQNAAFAQLGKGDIVVGLSTSMESYRVYDASADMWSNGPGWEPAFVQGIEFDNTNGVSHNASGNLLGVNFGNSFTGFEIYNLATDGTANSESAWSIVEATGGTRGMNPMGAWISERGGGLSVSPDNTKIAWTNYDSAQIYVHDYSPGSNPGSGMGAMITGPRRTGLGNGTGGAGTLTPLAPAITQGTTWLNNNTVAAFNGFGEIITLDVSGHSGGTEDGTLAGWNPTEMTNWRIVNSEVVFTADFTDIEYNPLVDPNHIFASVQKDSTFDTELFLYDYNTTSGAITLNRSIAFSNAAGEEREPREIGLDAEGNLFFSGYAGSSSDNLVMVLRDATNPTNWMESNVEVFFNTAVNSSFNGLDVALGPEPSGGLLGDYNDNGTVDAADYVAWRNAGPTDTLPNDPTSGTVDQSDYDLWRSHFGEVEQGAGLGSAAVPEPVSGVLSFSAIVCYFAMSLAKRDREKTMA